MHILEEQETISFTQESILDTDQERGHHKRISFKELYYFNTVHKINESSWRSHYTPYAKQDAHCTSYRKKTQLMQMTWTQNVDYQKKTKQEGREERNRTFRRFHKRNWAFVMGFGLGWSCCCSASAPIDFSSLQT